MRIIVLSVCALAAAATVVAGRWIAAPDAAVGEAAGGGPASERSTVRSRPVVRTEAVDAIPAQLVETEQVATLPPEGDAAAVAIDIGTTDVSDGALNLSANTTINLGLAASLCDCDGGGQLDDPCRWDCPSPVAGQGVYDAEKWAVVFKYSSVNITAGTVNFQNHPSRAPVVWLVQGNVGIGGTVSLNGSGQNGAGAEAEPGPGGFRGGRGTINGNWGSGGHGPGGGGFVTSVDRIGTGGSYGTQGGGSDVGPIYGFAGIYPLIGGSGGSGNSYVDYPYGGGAGGGAILIAAKGSVSVTSVIEAQGSSGVSDSAYFYNRSSGGGSGGSIRILADTVAGTGALRTTGGAANAGGLGRIRLEGITIPFSGSSTPAASKLQLTGPPTVWGPSDTPVVRATKILASDGVTLLDAVPPDPRASFALPQEDVLIDSDTAVTVEIEAANVPLDWIIKVRAVQQSGAVLTSANAVAQTGSTQASSVWQTQLTLPRGFSALQVRASKP
jgi:hypothetical protein